MKAAAFPHARRAKSRRARVPEKCVIQFRVCLFLDGVRQLAVREDAMDVDPSTVSWIFGRGQRIGDGHDRRPALQKSPGAATT